MRVSRAYNPRYVPVDETAAAGVCAWPGCGGEARYPAPRSRDDLRDYVHFCLDHVRAYNADWNYFAGMSMAEIDAFRHDDVTGHRPTWRIGARVRAAFVRGTARDPFGFMRRGAGWAEGPGAGPGPRVSAEERRALEALGFEAPAPLSELKARFKALVKRFHPDANGGDERASERLRIVIHAYRFLVAKMRDVPD